HPRRAVLPHVGILSGGVGDVVPRRRAHGLPDPARQEAGRGSPDARLHPRTRGRVAPPRSRASLPAGSRRVKRRAGVEARQAARAKRTARPVTATRCSATLSISTALTSSTSNRTSTIASAPYSAASRFKASIAARRSSSDPLFSAARHLVVAF